MERQLHIPVRPSRLARCCEGLLLLFAVLAVLACGLPLLAQLLVIALGVLPFALWTWRQHSHLLTALHWEDGTWRLLLGDRCEPVTLAPHYYSGFGVLCLHALTASGKAVPVVLWPDSADREQLRRLRLLLRQAPG